MMLPQTVLIVEDQKHMLLLLHASVEPIGCQILTASSGEEALAKAAAAPIDLLLIDYELSGPTGVQTVRQLKQSLPYAHLPAILITGRGEMRIRAEAALAGVTLVMLKPFSPTELLETVRQCLTGSKPTLEPEACKKV
jgi:CheY-like chemotaxis protein